ncbi:hypothetical protein [Aliikangiella sp. G2MR2-5]|uniref:hypothetical protein n=1 Tax=Aliikangiella sp. G2MR2-5 TaxID=2788943 RepID=UPI0018AC465A|nr:hypothetical protein [Aliikangiella sp. G2MR2-5]
MSVVEHLNPMLAAVFITGALTIYNLISLILKVRKLKLVSAFSRLFSLFVFTTVTGALSIILLGTQGYNALTREEKVARVIVTPVGQQSFHARLRFNDGTEQVFSLSGDELLIDAHILKWKSWTNILGLHTGYRLDRIAGRYRAINDEKSKERSVFAIQNTDGKGIAQWREDFSMLSALLDVEHGSASFVAADKQTEYSLMVTTDGLLLRPLTQDL